MATSHDYRALVNQYKTNLLKYQPGPKWHFGGIESGIDFEGNPITIDEMKRLVAKVSPIGPEVPEEEVTDVTPDWETYKAFEDYNAYQMWIESQHDAFYYSREKESFSAWEAYRIAAKLGYRKVIMENLS